VAHFTVRFYFVLVIYIDPCGTSESNVLSNRDAFLGGSHTKTATATFPKYGYGRFFCFFGLCNGTMVVGKHLGFSRHEWPKTHGSSIIVSRSKHQNWAGSLLVANFYKYHIDPTLSQTKEQLLGKMAMLYTLLAAGIIAFQFDSLLTMVQYLFAITAGVGPVFMLRWYWWRINAWSQLSAMLAGIVYPIVYRLLYSTSPVFQQAVYQARDFLHLDDYMLSLVILTLAVSFTWLLVTFLTPPTAFSHAQHFVNTVKPGGYWPGFQDHCSAFRVTRSGAWVLKTTSGFAMYLTFWNFVTQKYSAMCGFFVLYVLCFLGAYFLLAKANTQYEAQFLD